MARRSRQFRTTYGWAGGGSGYSRVRTPPGSVGAILGAKKEAEMRARVSGGSVSVKAHLREGRAVSAYTRHLGPTAKGLLARYRGQKRHSAGNPFGAARASIQEYSRSLAGNYGVLFFRGVGRDPTGPKAARVLFPTLNYKYKGTGTSMPSKTAAGDYFRGFRRPGGGGLASKTYRRLGRRTKYRK